MPSTSLRTTCGWIAFVRIFAARTTLFVLVTVAATAKLFAGLRIVLEEVILHKALGRLAHPLEEGEVLELV
jgi:hypothetical protein